MLRAARTLSLASTLHVLRRGMASAPTHVKVALCQILSGTDKAANLRTAVDAIAAAAADGAKLIALPECFNSPYATDQFPVYAEPIPTRKADIDPELHPSVAALSAAAAAHGVYLIGGSIPERAAPATPGGAPRIYNTCVAFGPDGELLARHRKVHLFDIDVPGRITFRESDTLTGGDRLAVFDTPFGRVGLGICYDMRFPQLALLLRAAGCTILAYPGAFNTTTGPVHWELLQRARAVDAQCFVLTPAPARSPDAKYQAWGHSTVVSPWGEVLATTDERPGTVTAELRVAHTAEVRAAIPVGDQARADLYALEWRGPPRELLGAAADAATGGKKDA